MKFQRMSFSIIVILMLMFSFLIREPAFGQEEDDMQILYSSYFGGSHEDSSWSFVLDDNDNIYLTGTSNSTDFPITPTAYLKEKPSLSFDVFVSKLSADGSTLLFSTWLGPATRDTPSLTRVALDSTNNIIISGTTNSDDFPTTPDAFNQSRSGKNDNFLSVLSNDGSTLIYSTYIGGENDEYLSALSIDSQNKIYISGNTHSSYFPVTNNAYDESYNGNLDLFITKFSSNGKSLEYSTYLGGTEHEETYPSELVFDSYNNLIIAGSTRSTDFPTTPDAFDNSYNGGQMIPPGSGRFCCGDVTISKLSENGSNLLYSTFLGGSSGEKAHGLNIDADNNIYLTGSTRSSDFPVTENAFGKSYSGDYSTYTFFGDIFVTKLEADGKNLTYSTYIGGKGLDLGGSIILDDKNQAIITGVSSSDVFDLKGETDITFDSSDAFVLKLSADGSTILGGIENSTILGGTSGDGGNHIAFDSQGKIVLVGFTFSDNFTISSNAWTDQFGGIRDIFIAKIGKGTSKVTNATEGKSTIGFMTPMALIGITLLIKRKNR